MNPKVVSKLILYSFALLRAYMKPRAKSPGRDAQRLGEEARK